VNKAKLLFLWSAMGVFPVWAQTGASLSRVETDQTSAALPVAAVTPKNAEAGVMRLGPDTLSRFSLVVPSDYPVLFDATLAKTYDNDWITLKLTRPAASSLTQGQAQAPAQRTGYSFNRI
jgi:hypothetical protein